MTRNEARARWPVSWVRRVLRAGWRIVPVVEDATTPEHIAERKMVARVKLVAVPPDDELH